MWVNLRNGGSKTRACECRSTGERYVGTRKSKGNGMTRFIVTCIIFDLI